MSDIKNNINIYKLRILLDKWKETNIEGNNIDLNKLADYTLKVIDGEPLIKEICNAFLCSISIQAIKDPNFDKETYKNISTKGTGLNNTNTRKKLEK